MSEETKAKRILLLLSGGLDSVSLFWSLRDARESFEAVYFCYGSNHMEQERKYAQKHCEAEGVPLRTVVLPKLSGSRLTGESGSWVVPGRNGVLLSWAANIAEAEGFDFIDYACNADDAAGFPDCRPEWVGAFNVQLAAAEIKCRVITPFISMTKRQIVYFAKKRGAPIEESWSCYQDGIKECGKCDACKKRQEAFR